MENEGYIPQIRISADDPINSVKSLNGTVIGILFEKTSDEIKESIDNRFKLIDGKVKEYEFMCSKTESFIEKKKKELKELNEYRQDRINGKKVFLLPIQKEIERMVKEANDKIYEMDNDTYEEVKKKAFNFEKEFDSVKEDFDQLDDLLMSDRVIARSSNSGGTFLGQTGPTGAPGHAGTPGHVGSSGPSSELEIHTNPENRAYVKLEQLKDLLRRYTDKLDSLKDSINKLNDEKRRLKLTYDNLDKDRTYKLDLNMLSAFGFEN